MNSLKEFRKELLGIKARDVNEAREGVITDVYRHSRKNFVVVTYSGSPIHVPLQDLRDFYILGPAAAD
jgi:hypothetical protein